MGRITRASAVVLVGVMAGSGIWYATSGASPKPRLSTTHAVTSCSSTAYDLSLSFATTGGATTTVPVSGQISFSAAAATASVVVPSSFPVAALAGTTEQVVLIKGTLYLAVPSSLSSFVGGASWVSFPLPSSVDHAVDTIGLSLADWCGNASSLVNALEARGGTATSKGTSTIGGVPVNETQVTIQAKRLVPLVKVIRRIDSKIVSQMATASVTIDIWANSSSNQLVQLSADATGLSSHLGLSNVSLTVDLTDVDQPVTITAPAGAVALSKSMVRTLMRTLGAALS